MKKVFFLGLLLVFLVGAVVPIWAISPPERGPENPFLRSRIGRQISEATERGRKATPPGLLRSKMATPEGRPNILKHRVYIGTVSAILAGQTFTLSTKDGSRTVQTNEKTRFIQGKFKDGVKATFESLRPEDRVIAVGQVNEKGLMTAKIVVIIPAKAPQIKRRAVYGVVEQKIATDSGTLLTLRHPLNQKVFQVIVNAQTKITGKGLTNATINDIQIGNRVAAVGTVDESGKITAKRLHIIAGLARGLFGTQPSTPSFKPATPPGWWKRPTVTPTVTPPATPTATPTPSGD